MEKKDKITFILPCYNEEENVSLIYKDIHKDFDKVNVDLELIFVNDGSSDNTDREIKRLINKDDSIKYINFSRNFGKEAAMYAGLEHSTGDYITIIDTDLQQPPSVVRRMYEKIKEDSSVDCIGTYQLKRKESKIKSFLSNMFYKISNMFLEIPLKENASDFRLFNKTVKEAMLKFTEHQRFTKGIFSWIGFNVKFIEYEPKERQFGTTKWSLRKLIAYSIDGIIPYSNKIMHLPMFFGILLFIVSMVLLILSIFKNIFIYAYVTLLFSIVLIMMGILSTYVQRIYKESLNRPIYVAKEIISKEK